MNRNCVRTVQSSRRELSVASFSISKFSNAAPQTSSFSSNSENTNPKKTNYSSSSVSLSISFYSELLASPQRIIHSSGTHGSLRHPIARVSCPWTNIFSTVVQIFRIRSVLLPRSVTRNPRKSRLFSKSPHVTCISVRCFAWFPAQYSLFFHQTSVRKSSHA